MKDFLDRAREHLLRTMQSIDEGCNECKDCIKNDCKGYKVKRLLRKAYGLFPKKGDE